MKKSILLIMLAFLCILISSSCSSRDDANSLATGNSEANMIKEIVKIDASYPWYNDIDSLVRAADLIAEGIVTNSRVESIYLSNNKEESPIIYTVYNIKITRVYKGSTQHKESFEVKQLGGEDATTAYIANDVTPLKSQSSYLFFLEVYDDAPASLLNPIQGLYQITDGAFIAHEENPIKVTAETLKSLASQW